MPDLCRILKKKHQNLIFYFLFFIYLNPRKPIRIEEIHSGVYPPCLDLDLSTDPGLKSPLIT
jgi:hypothetical protein